MLSRLAATGILVLALCAAIPAQQTTPPAQPPAGQQPPGRPPQTPPPPDQQQRPPVIKSGINFVSVDVIITDKKTGNLVLDLTKDDFEVREDKKPQRVDTFDVVKIDPVEESAHPVRQITSADAEEAEAKKPNTRLFILLLDDYHVRRGNDLVIRQPLMDFVQNQLAPEDMVAVMYPMTPVTALTFTRNRDSLVSAIKNFVGRKGVYDPQNEFEERYANQPAAAVEDIRNDVTLGALRGAAVRLGGMRDGRKTIVFVSEGFVSKLPAQVNDPIASMPHIGNNAQPGQDYTNPRQQSQDFFNSVDLTDRIRMAFETANRNNTSIYSVDPRGLATNEYGIEQGVSLQSDRVSLNESIDSLRVLSDNSDGRAIVNRNDLAVGMKQIIRDASGYYLLGYTSSSAPTDGKFHTIDVHVKRPGVDVRARKGYYAYTAEEAVRASSPPKPGPPSAVADALNAIAEPISGGHPARFWLGTDQAANGQSRVTFAWEPLEPKVGARPTDVPSRVTLTVTAPDGHPIFRGRVPDIATDAAAPPPDPAAVPVAAAGASVSFNAPPGLIEIRMLVEGARGQVVDSTTREFTVPDYATAQVAFGTPRLYRARTVREMTLLRNNLDAPPTAAREFSRGERVLLRVDAYAAGGARPEVTAKLLNRTGQTMADVPVQSVEGKPFQIDFPLASLSAGEYILELDAKSAAGTAQQMVGFKVGASPPTTRDSV